MLLFGLPTSRCYGWGEPIYAPLDGEVIAASDGLLERARVHPIRELALVLRTALTFRPTRSASRGCSATTSFSGPARSMPPSRT